MRRQLFVLFVLILLLAGGLQLAQAQVEWVGCKYLTAGTNITITCPDTAGRNGATISASGGGGTPGGSSGQIQYNNATAFDGSTIWQIDSLTPHQVIFAVDKTAAEVSAFIDQGSGGSIGAAVGNSGMTLTGLGGSQPTVNFYQASGTYAAPTKTVAGASVGKLIWYGHSGTGLGNNTTALSLSVVAQSDFDASTAINAVWGGDPGSTFQFGGADLGTTGNKWANAFFSGTVEAVNFNVASGGSTTISTGVGSVKMSTANPGTNTAWIPIKYAGTTYFVPGWTTNAP